MGKIHTIVARLVALTAAFVIGFPQPATADDAGPRRDVRAIRYDLPRLMAGQDFSTPGRTITIDAVAVDGSTALAQWHDTGTKRIEYLVNRFDRWWIDREIWIQSSDGIAISGDACSRFGAASWMLTSYFDVPKPLATLAAQSLPDVIAADARPAPSGFSGNVIPGCDVITYSVDNVRFNQQTQSPSNLGGYAMAVRLAISDADSSARIADVRGRPPTEAESWVTRGGNSYFFFSGTVQSNAPIHVAAGTTIDVWFPFVLDPSLYYGLTIAHADKPIGPIDGTLKDNVVRFVLPAFTLPPGATLMGEIEGDTFRHES